MEKITIFYARNGAGTRYIPKRVVKQNTNGAGRTLAAVVRLATMFCIAYTMYHATR